MIKFVGTNDDKPFVGLGLSRRNFELLMQGRPIQITGKDLGIPFDILILGGETEEAMRSTVESWLDKPIPIVHHGPGLESDHKE